MNSPPQKLSDDDIQKFSETLRREMILFGNAIIQPLIDAIREQQRSIGLLMDGQTLIEKALADQTFPDFWENDEPPNDDD